MSVKASLWLAWYLVLLCTVINICISIYEVRSVVVTNVDGALASLQQVATGVFGIALSQSMMGWVGLSVSPFITSTLSSAFASFLSPSSSL